jgi:hypothetical protein
MSQQSQMPCNGWTPLETSATQLHTGLLQVRVANVVPHLGVEHAPAVIVHGSTWEQAARFSMAVHFPTKSTQTTLGLINGKNRKPIFHQDHVCVKA